MDNTSNADPIPRMLRCLHATADQSALVRPQYTLIHKQIMFLRVTAPDIATVDLAGCDTTDPLEPFGKGEVVIVANLMGHAGDPLTLDKKFRSRRHPPTSDRGQWGRTDSPLAAAIGAVTGRTSTQCNIAFGALIAILQGIGLPADLALVAGDQGAIRDRFRSLVTAVTSCVFTVSLYQASTTKPM